MKKAIIIIVWVLMQSVACSGQGWFELGTGANALNANDIIYTICTDDSNNIYAAGLFRDSSGTHGGGQYVAKWTAAKHNWCELGTDSNRLNADAQIFTICTDRSGNVFAAGNFTKNPRMLSDSYYVAKWDITTSEWEPLGGASNALYANNAISAICSDGSGNIYAAGGFRDSIGFWYVAKWNGFNWGELGMPFANAEFFSICADDSGDIYATGSFTDYVGLQYVAKWSHITGFWTEVGSGFDSTYPGVSEITCIKVDHNGHIYIAINYLYDEKIFEWTGARWEELSGLNVNNSIDAIAVNDSGYVYAGGSFTTATGENYVAEFNPLTHSWGETGESSNPFINHVSIAYNATINALCIDNNNNLYAGGAFTDSISPTNNFMYVAEYGINTLEVKTITNDCTINVYPNPATENISITYSSFSGLEVSEYYLYDVIGKLCLQGKLLERGITTVDISALRPGIFLLAIGQKMFKIIKY